MDLYSYIEENYCTKCKKNVAIENKLQKNGKIKKICLHKGCIESIENGVPDFCKIIKSK